MEIDKNQIVLILAPHTDDGELGCGGTISKLSENGNKIYQIAFSSAGDIVNNSTRNLLLEFEIKQASQIVGIKPENLFIENFSVRNFTAERQRILDLMIYYKKLLNPDIIFVTSKNDCHQDHRTIYNEALRTFKYCTILSYQLPWNLFKFNLQLYIHISKKHLDNKINAIECYKSQSHRKYCNSKYIESLAICNGVATGTDYAEVFEVIRINVK